MEPALKLAIVSSGLFFLTGLLTGVWKYLHISRSPTAEAPAYVDICHRTALLYSFACLLLAKFVELSVWSNWVDLAATIALIAFFANAVIGYAVHGAMQDTDNQFMRPHVFGKGTIPDGFMKGLMWSLVVAEVGGFSVLFVGAMKGIYA